MLWPQETSRCWGWRQPAAFPGGSAPAFGIGEDTSERFWGLGAAASFLELLLCRSALSRSAFVCLLFLKLFFSPVTNSVTVSLCAMLPVFP